MRTALLLSCLLPTIATAGPQDAEAPKNVILIIGDGMGPQQVGLLELYARRAPKSPLKRSSAFSRISELGSVGLSMHYPMDRAVVDSACSATQLALGVAAPSQAIGIDADGNPQQTVLELAQSLGKATGLVSDTRLTHATPAAFAAHVAHRRMENEIAAQMVETGPDLMMSGGWRHFVGREVEGSKRKDDRDILEEAEAAGYTVVKDREALMAVGDGKLLGLFAKSGMMNAIAEFNTRDDEDRTEPSLTEMTTVALDRLSQDEDGFFLMIESGQIDWSCHANDAGWLMKEMLRANEMLHTVVDWAEERGDTLVVVTADHETGGFGLSYSRVGLPEPRKLPGTAFQGMDYAPGWNFGPLENLDLLAAQSSHLDGVMYAFGDLPKKEQTPEKLVEMVNAVSEFKLDVDGAKRVLTTGPDAWHEGEGEPRVGPILRDFGAFYYHGNYGPVLARELAASQNVVWATGTHTHTPVPVFAFGPGYELFSGLQHHTDIGQDLIRVVRGDMPKPELSGPQATARTINERVAKATRDCISDLADELPEISGIARLIWTVGPKKIKGRVDANTTGAKTLTKCIINRVKAQGVPDGATGRITVPTTLDLTIKHSE